VISCISATSVLWYFNGQSRVINNGLVNENKLYLFNVKRNYGGVYECRGTTDHGLKFSAYSRLKIVGIKVKPDTIQSKMWKHLSLVDFSCSPNTCIALSTLKSTRKSLTAF